MALLLVPHLGPEGAAIAQASTLVFSNALRLYLVWRFVHIQPYDRDYARLLIPTAIGAAAMIVVHSMLHGPKWAPRPAGHRAWSAGWCTTPRSCCSG